MDRFDSMRSKGINTNDADATAEDIASGKTAYVKGQKITGTSTGGGGGDIPLFGSTVTVQALKAVTKGQMWQGVESDSYDDTLGSSMYTNIPGDAWFSDDLKVVMGGISTTSSSNPTVECSIKIGFLDESSNSYILKTVSLPGTSYESIASRYTSTFAFSTINAHIYHINYEGTLAICTIPHRGTDSAVTDEYGKYTYQTFALEINRAEKKIEVYPINITGFDGSYSSGRVAVLENYIFAQTANQKVEIYSYNGGNVIHIYNYNTAALLPKSRFHMIKTADGYVIPMKSSDYYSTVYYLKETADGLSITWKPAYGKIKPNSSLSYYVFSVNQKYAIIGTTDSQATYLARFNYADWTIGDDVCKLPAYYVGALFKDTSDYAVLYETSSRRSFYRIENNSVTLLKSNLPIPSAGYVNVYFTATRFMTMDGNVYTLGSNEAQYLIEPWLTATKEEGKAYGIVSESIVAGDTGTAQLL